MMHTHVQTVGQAWICYRILPAKPRGPGFRSQSSKSYKLFPLQFARLFLFVDQVLRPKYLQFKRYIQKCTPGDMVMLIKTS